VSKTKELTFAEACNAWFDTADRYADFGASDTEPRSVFAQIIVDLYKGTDPVIPTKASSDAWSEPNWQLYSGEDMRGNGLAAAALTRAARRAVEIGKRDHLGLVRYVKDQGWAW
jgi:hypothetical protein